MPTALELTPEERAHYIRAARHRPPQSELTPAQREEREHLLERIREVVAVLRTRFDARRVILFGSLAHGAWFTPDSDVDMAVEGLKGDTYWGAWRLLEEAIPDRTVDVVSLETASVSLRQAIERHGIEL